MAILGLLLVLLAVSALVFVAVDLLTYDPDENRKWLNWLLSVLCLPTVIVGNVVIFIWSLLTGKGPGAAYELSFYGLWTDVKEIWAKGY